MRIYELFQDVKLLTTNNHLKKESLNLKQNHSKKLERCKIETLNYPVLRYIKTKAFTNVSISFSSFEQDDLFLSLKLYNNYIAKLTNILNTSNLPVLSNIPINNKINLKTWRRSDTENTIKYLITLKALKFKDLSYLRTVRDINNYHNHYNNNSYNCLYTVIKSPHVYKKTREQFALSHNKAGVYTKIKNNTTTSLYINFFLGLKFPVEIKMVLKAL